MQSAYDEISFYNYFRLLIVNDDEKKKKEGLIHIKVTKSRLRLVVKLSQEFVVALELLSKNDA